MEVNQLLAERISQLRVVVLSVEGLLDVVDTDGGNVGTFVVKDRLKEILNLVRTEAVESVHLGAIVVKISAESLLRKDSKIGEEEIEFVGLSVEDCDVTGD